MRYATKVVGSTGPGPTQMALLLFGAWFADFAAKTR